MSSLTSVLLFLSMALTCSASPWLGMASASCYSYLEIPEEQSFIIQSPNYPYWYPPNTQCTWLAVTWPGSRLHLQCDNVNIPVGWSYWSDHVIVSPTGMLLSGQAKYFNGRDRIAVDSEDNVLAVKLEAWGSLYGGFFRCAITSIPACTCGIRQQLQRIAGGFNTTVREFPMMASLVDLGHREQYCGATILSEEFVLTAAHCVAGLPLEEVVVHVGDHLTGAGSDTSAFEEIAASEVTIHWQYDNKTLVNDLALVRLSRPAIFSNSVGPACLPFRYRDQTLVGHELIVLGWGLTKFSGQRPEHLQQTRLKVINETRCRAEHPAQVITEEHLCTFAVDADACQFDSGGPLLHQDPATGQLFLVGVISHGSLCATRVPGINTRVAAFLDWIQQETQAEFCFK